jgi:hypothetical protein
MAVNKVMLQTIWSFSAGFSNIYAELQTLAEKYPVYFAALLKFATQKNQEYADAVRHR